MTKLRRILFALRIALRQGDIVLKESVWSEHDRAAYDYFRRTPTGERLNLILRNYIAKCAIEACESGKTERVAGIRETITFLDTLRPNFGAIPTDGNSRESDAHSDTETEDSGAFTLEPITT